MSDAQLLTQCARSHMAAQEGQAGWDVGMSGTPSCWVLYEGALALLKAAVTIPGNSPDFGTVVIFLQPSPTPIFVSQVALVSVTFFVF